MPYPHSRNTIHVMQSKYQNTILHMTNRVKNVCQALFSKNNIAKTTYQSNLVTNQQTKWWQMTGNLN